MNDVPPKSPGRPRSAAAHQAMLKAALELLAEVGFAAISIEAIANRAGVGKTTIYRRYRSKHELIADAIESLRDTVEISNTGTLWGDLTALIDNAAQASLTPLGRQSAAMIISSAASHPEFAQIYAEKYLKLRRQAFANILERAKTRAEIAPDLDTDLVFNAMSGIMLYALIFPPPEAWTTHVRRALELLLR
jgi:AcrR family transcriptional regulator